MVAGEAIGGKERGHIPSEAAVELRGELVGLGGGVIDRGAGG